MDIRKFNPSSEIPTSIFRPIKATGGVESIISYQGYLYKIHLFTTTGSSTFSVIDAGSDGLAEVLVVGGGGGGGMDMGGGGGGGGVVFTRYQVLPGENIPVVVGFGGQGAPGGNGYYRTDGTGPQPSAHQFTISATNGTNSVFGSITASGGGYGGSSYYAYTPNNGIGAIGGSGGGTSAYSDGTTKAGQVGVTEQGHQGGQGGGQYYSGGGGGAGCRGADSTNQPNGGDGILIDILGVDLYWGGGGGGSSYTLSTGGNGGRGGGGGGALGTTTGGSGYNSGQGGYGGSPNSQTNTKGGSAGVNTGGGGGGGSHYNNNNGGGEGGSGIVIVRYPVERSLPRYISSGLKLYLDTTNPASYPGTGTSWTDLSQGLVFSSNGTQTPFSSVGGASAFSFNGSGNWTNSASPSLVDMAGDCTLIMWLYGNTPGASRSNPFEKAGNTYQSYEQEIATTWETNGTLTWYSRQGSYDSAATGSLSSGAWNMVAIKMSSGKVQGARRTGFYSINGANWISNYTANSVNSILTAGTIRIGTGYAGTVSSGAISVVMVYNRLLTNNEISQNYEYFRRSFGR